MDDLTHLWKNFTLTEDESCAVEAYVQGLHHTVDRGKTCLVGKLLADRLIGKNAIRSTLIKGWRSARNTSFTNLGDNMFLIEFEHFLEKDRILEGHPWVFEGNLFSVEEFNGTVAPSSLEFDKVLIWVRMFQLPLSCMSETMGVQLGSSVGQVVEVETEEDGVGWGEYLWVCIRVDLSKPLVRRRMLKLNGISTWIAFQYEKLPKFCFQCGMVLHGMGGCLNLREAGRKGILPQVQFGVWLRADGFGRRPKAGGVFIPFLLACLTSSREPSLAVLWEKGFTLFGLMVVAGVVTISIHPITAACALALDLPVGRWSPMLAVWLRMQLSPCRRQVRWSLLVTRLCMFSLNRFFQKR